MNKEGVVTVQGEEKKRRQNTEERSDETRIVRRMGEAARPEEARSEHPFIFFVYLQGK